MIQYTNEFLVFDNWVKGYMSIKRYNKSNRGTKLVYLTT